MFDNSSKRKFQCFVCGVAFTDFQEFTSHIIDNHEQGREYVLCPLARCQAPVRDVKAHFKAMHPSETLPKVGQMKAIIWKDVMPDGKMKTRKPQFRKGYYESTKMGKSIYYHSGWECTVYELLDSWNQVLAYDAEPFKIPYIHEGNCHDYIPDLFVAFTDGKKAVYEIKPSNQTHLEKNKDKWFAAKKACEARGWDFVVVTEQVIEKLKKTVKNQHLINEDEDD